MDVVTLTLVCICLNIFSLKFITTEPNEKLNSLHDISIQKSSEKKVEYVPHSPNIPCDAV